MKIFVEYYKEHNDSVEIVLNHQELKCLVAALKKFEDSVNQIKEKKQCGELGDYTHLHLQDCGIIDEANGNADLVFYVNVKEGTNEM